MTNNRKYYIGDFDTRDGTNFLDRKIGVYNSRSKRLGRLGVDSESSAYNLGINKGQDYNMLPSPNIITTPLIDIISSGYAENTTSVTIPSVSPGNIIIGFANRGNSDINVPAGYTQIAVRTGTNPRSIACYKEANGSETNFTVSGTSAVYYILLNRGNFDVGGSSYTTVSGNQINIPGITPQKDSLIFVHAVLHNTDAPLTLNETGYDTSISEVYGSDQAIGVWSKRSDGTSTGTITVSGETNNQFIGLVFSFK